MVSRQGKDLLRNTIRSTGYHNRLLEEDDMWRQWDLERGLTMMVTDDCLKKKLRMDQYPKPLKSSLSHPNRDHYWTKKLFKVEEKDPDRWGHSGYKELYPEEFYKRRPKSPSHSPSPSPSYDRRKKSRKSKKFHSHHKRKRRDHNYSEDDKEKSTSHHKHKKLKADNKKGTGVLNKKKNSPEPSSKTNSQSSEEEGECEKSKSDKESCSDLNSMKSNKSSASSTSDTSSSESSEDERLQEQQLQRLARFRRHFRSCSVEKECQDEKNSFNRDLNERIKCECNGNVDASRKRAKKHSKVNKHRR